MSTWQEKLESFRKLENGWDSYRADPPSDLSIANARSFIEEAGVPYRVSPTVVGGVACTYRKEEKITIEFYNNGKCCAIWDTHLSRDQWKTSQDLKVILEKTRELCQKV